MRTSVAVAAAVLATGALAGCLGGAGDGAEPLGASGGRGAWLEGVFSDTHAFPGEYDLEQPRTLEPGPFAAGVQETTLVPSARDGADIMIYVMRPDVPAATRVPVILDASPYFPPMQDVDLSGNGFVVHNIVSQGYAFAVVAVRGTGDSGGCMDMMGPAEMHDIDQAVTWLGTQPWSNGNVGMFGGSYDGSTQWQAASTGNPHLKTIVPIAAIPDMGGFLLHNGSVMTWTPLQFTAFYWIIYGPLSYHPLNGRSVPHTAEQLACPSSAEGTATSALITLTGERDPLGYWAERDWREDILANYRGSVYMVHGLQDVTVEPHNAYPFVTELESRGVVVKHTVGPWGHELPWRADSMEIMMRWYDRWLKDEAQGGGAGVDVGPKAQVMDNLGMWRSEPAWPPLDAAPRTLFLAPDGALAPEPPAVSGEEPVALSVPVHDPGGFGQGLNGHWKLWEDPDAELCGACPSFTTGPLEEDLRFAGLPTLHLTVTPTGPGGHVTALMYAAHPDGARERVGMAQMDLRFAAGGEASRPVVPGQPLTARMQFQPTDAVVPAGSELVLVLTQGSYGIRMPSLPTYPVLVSTGGEAGVLALPAITRGPEKYHDAPPRVGPEAGPV